MKRKKKQNFSKEVIWSTLILAFLIFTGLTIDYLLKKPNIKASFKGEYTITERMNHVRLQLTNNKGWDHDGNLLHKCLQTGNLNIIQTLHQEGLDRFKLLAKEKNKRGKTPMDYWKNLKSGDDDDDDDDDDKVEALFSIFQLLSGEGEGEAKELEDFFLGSALIKEKRTRKKGLKIFAKIGEDSEKKHNALHYAAIFDAWYIIKQLLISEEWGDKEVLAENSSKKTPLSYAPQGSKSKKLLLPFKPSKPLFAGYDDVKSQFFKNKEGLFLAYQRKLSRHFFHEANNPWGDGDNVPWKVDEKTKTFLRVTSNNKPSLALDMEVYQSIQNRISEFDKGAYRITAIRKLKGLRDSRNRNLFHYLALFEDYDGCKKICEYAKECHVDLEEEWNACDEAGSRGTSHNSQMKFTPAAVKNIEKINKSIEDLLSKGNLADFIQEPLKAENHRNLYHYAVLKNNKKLFSWLMNDNEYFNRTDLSVRDVYGKVPADYIADLPKAERATWKQHFRDKSGSVKMPIGLLVKSLFSRKGNIEKDDAGNTLVHFAVKNARRERYWGNIKKRTLFMLVRWKKIGEEGLQTKNDMGMLPTDMCCLEDGEAKNIAVKLTTEMSISNRLSNFSGKLFQLVMKRGNVGTILRNNRVSLWLKKYFNLTTGGNFS